MLYFSRLLRGGREFRRREWKKPWTCPRMGISSVQFSCSVMSKSLQPMDYSTPGLPGMGIAKLLLNSIGVPGRLGIPVISNAHNSNYTLSLRIILLIPKCKILKNRRGRRYWMGQVGVWGRPRKTNKNSEFPACEEPPAKVCPFKSLLGLISKSFQGTHLPKSSPKFLWRTQPQDTTTG